MGILDNTDPAFTDQEIYDVTRRAIEITEEINPPEWLRTQVFANVLHMVGLRTDKATAIAVPTVQPVSIGRMQ